MNAREWVAALTVAGTGLQIGVLVFGWWALRRSYRRAKAIVDATANEDESTWPPPTTIYKHGLYMREWITFTVVEHSWKQATGALAFLILGAAMTGVASVWSLYLPA